MAECGAGVVTSTEAVSREGDLAGDLRKEVGDEEDPLEEKLCALWKRHPALHRAIRGMEHPLREFLEFFASIWHCCRAEDEVEKIRRIAAVHDRGGWRLKAAEVDLGKLLQTRQADEILVDLWWFDLRSVQAMARAVELSWIVAWLNEVEPTFNLQAELDFACHHGSRVVRQGVARLVIALLLHKPEGVLSLNLPS